MGSPKHHRFQYQVVVSNDLDDDWGYEYPHDFGISETPMYVYV